MGTGITQALNWRYAFVLLGLPGLLLALVLLCCIPEPRREGRAQPLSTTDTPPDAAGPHSSETTTTTPAPRPSAKTRLVLVGRATHQLFRDLWHLCHQPLFIMVCVASALRNSGGYVWGLNAELFFENSKGLAPSYIR